MASKDLIEAVTGLENYISVNGVTDKAIEVYCNACNTAIVDEKDIDYGLTLTKRAKGLISEYSRLQTNLDFYGIERFCQENKKDR